MHKLAKYDNTTVRIVCEGGETFSGACAWFPPEYGLSEFGREEEGLQIGDAVIFSGEILQLELLRPEAVIPVRDWPEAKEEIALWFHEKWGVPLEAYRESILECLGRESGVPQWYVVVRGEKIVAGCGVIENDFHERKDLAPNVCAVYVEEEYRNQGIAGFLLNCVCDDMAAMGVGTLYLLTDHTGFYERYGWEFFCMVQGEAPEPSRMYVHRAPVVKKP